MVTTWWPKILRRLKKIKMAIVKNHSTTTHLFVLNVPFESNPTIRFSSLLAPKPGLITSAFPQTRHVSFLSSPKHHPPGTTCPGRRFKISLSIRLSNGSFNLNLVAKAAPLSIMILKSEGLRNWGCSLGGFSNMAYSKLSLKAVLLNWELQRTVGK